MSFFQLLRSSLTTVLNPVRSVSIVGALPAVRPNILIGTHDGSFHCDEALAISMLLLHPSYSSGACIVRTRNPGLLAEANIVVDVGAVYDPSTHRYDHHQREFTGVLEGYRTKLSSAGLVYKHFGREIIQAVLKTLGSSYADDATFLDVCYHKVYKEFMEHIDAIDNGIAVSEGEPRYRVSSTLSDRVGRLNPAWNEPSTPESINERFQEAMLLTCAEFVGHVYSLSMSWWPARSLVQQALDRRFDIDASGQIVLFEQHCPWKDHLFELENPDSSSQVLYVLYADAGGSWRIQAVPVTPHSFDSRKKLPEPWCGLRDQVLSEKLGLPGAIFVHASGFIGGHQTRDGAIAMAKEALKF